MTSTGTPLSKLSHHLNRGIKGATGNDRETTHDDRQGIELANLPVLPLQKNRRQSNRKQKENLFFFFYCWPFFLIQVYDDSKDNQKMTLKQELDQAKM